MSEIEIRLEDGDRLSMTIEDFNRFHAAASETIEMQASAIESLKATRDELQGLVMGGSTR